MFVYIETALNLTHENLTPIFTEVSDNVNHIGMTIEQQLIEKNTFNHIKGLWEKGLEANFIADAFKMPLQKVEEIIQKIMASSK